MNRAHDDAGARKSQNGCLEENSFSLSTSLADYFLCLGLTGFTNSR